MRQLLQRKLFRYGWDTRCRNLAAAHHLSSLFSDLGSEERTLLDVGSGEQGVSTFLRDVSVIAVDRNLSQQPNDLALHGDITALPFADRTFPVVSCIDVLEHLPVADREKAVGELVRVARRAVLMTFPCGSAATASDQAFLQACRERGRSEPDWVREHLKQPLPKSREISDCVRATARDCGHEARVTLYYNEPIAVSRFVRAAAARSSSLYLLANLVFGTLLNFVPDPGSDGSYRVILLATLE